MRGRRPYEQFRLGARRALGPDPVTVPGIAPFAGAHTARRYTGRNGYPMSARRPYERFCAVENPKPAAGAGRPGAGSKGSPPPSGPETTRGMPGAKRLPHGGRIPHGGFCAVAPEARGRGPADRKIGGAGRVRPGAHTARRYPGRNGYPMRGRIPYERFRPVA